MPPPSHSSFNDFIYGTLTQRSGDAPDAHTVVQAVAHTWHTMATQLEPVIGVRGVAVLLERAVHLTGKTYPWLVQVATQQDSADPMVRLQARFASRQTREAAEAGGALLVTFTELLAALIGEPLTERLLGCVWLDQDLPQAPVHPAGGAEASPMHVSPTSEPDHPL